ncbi:hypothetical protein TcCL_NonESM05693 [Trypanosoma cruzi]|nr:hypothetical protein TcCL_NonESM05693 [Trypanosoma cruzi]
MVGCLITAPSSSTEVRGWDSAEARSPPFRGAALRVSSLHCAVLSPPLWRQCVVRRTAAPAVFLQGKAPDPEKAAGNTCESGRRACHGQLPGISGLGEPQPVTSTPHGCGRGAEDVTSGVRAGRALPERICGTTGPEGTGRRTARSPSIYSIKGEGKWSKGSFILCIRSMQEFHVQNDFPWFWALFIALVYGCFLVVVFLLFFFVVVVFVRNGRGEFFTCPFWTFLSKDTKAF